MKSCISWIVAITVAATTFAQEKPDAPATQPATGIPSIVGVWQEAAGLFVGITQVDGNFKARCVYNLPDFGDVRWECNGTITPDGRVAGTLLHSVAPSRWKQTQIREGKLSPDGNTISGTATWDNSLHPFTWTRLPKIGTPATKEDPIAQKWRDDVFSQEKSILAQQSLEIARSSALAGLSQTPEYQQAEAAISDAQKQLDSADSDEARRAEVADKLSAKDRLARLQYSTLASGTAIKNAAKSADEATADFKLAEAQLNQARADQIASKKAAQAATEAAAEAAIPPEIKTAIAQHTLVVGMTLDQCNKAIGRDGKLVASDAILGTDYEWDYVVGPYGDKVKTTDRGYIPYTGVILNGKLTSFVKLPYVLLDSGTFRVIGNP